ncbi:hypothetical protein HJC23_013958 [Cyclotella cryptica]|uniref:W2 domain-containing protein n=1 Tax=Cyclotella cryptica TaxID=29204 RepID=A0ABD3Q281_9STRA
MASQRSGTGNAGSGYDRTNDRYDNRGNDRQDSWRRGGGSGGGDNHRGGGAGYDRDDGRRRGGPRFGGDDRGMPLSSSSNGSSTTQRPRLNLQKRTVDDVASQLETTELNDATDDAAEEEHGETTGGNVDGGDRPRQRERKFREPEVVNSRAAMLGDAAAPRKEELGDRRRDTRDRRTHQEGPPPIVNERFAKLAQEEKDKNLEREFSRRRDDRDAALPPSRFAAAAEADRSAVGPPPVPQNSRFAAAAEAYREDKWSREQERGERGAPPPVANSRFAAVAADYGRERDERDRERGERFAAAMEADADYVPAEMRNQRNNERGEDRGDRFGRGDGDDRRDGRGYGDDRRDGRGYGDDRRGGYGGGGGGGRYGDRGGRYNDRRDATEIELPRGPSWKQAPAAEENAFPPLNKGNVANILAPKKREEEVVLPPVAIPLTLPGEDEEAAKARLEKARLEKEAKAAKEKADEEARKAEEARLAEEARNRAAKALEVEATLLNEFISGNKLGADLQQWCADQSAVLPSVEKLIYHLLTEKEQKNPNPECPWAEPSQYGAALLSLVQDKAYEQMQVLWAIQKYCDSIGFPKLNDEYVVQTMFRAMYKYDLAEVGAFDEWKEDESEENSRGKTKAVIQTVDWFAWLEEDDEDDDEEYEEEEEEE